MKNATQWTLFGGINNLAFDPCYHQPCDNIYNINQQVYFQNAQAAATVLETLANTPNLSQYLGITTTVEREKMQVQDRVFVKFAFN